MFCAHPRSIDVVVANDLIVDTMVFCKAVDENFAGALASSLGKSGVSDVLNSAGYILTRWYLGWVSVDCPGVYFR